MSKPFERGDMVVAIHSCCKHSNPILGKIGKIRDFDFRDWKCLCGANGKGPRVVAFSGEHYCAPASWLMRMDPSEEQVEIEEEIYA